MPGRIFLTILESSLAASVAIVFVLAARLLLRRAPKVIAYALWGVVLVRLLCPVSLESKLSLMPERVELASGYAAQLPAPAAEAGEKPAQTVEAAHSEPLRGSAADGKGMWVTLGAYVWLAGVASMSAVSAGAWLRLRRRLRTAIPAGEGVWISEEISSPFVMGLLAPRIYLPLGVSDREKRYILLHERHHIRRLDFIWKLLAFAALALHWFNPLVWLAFSLAGKDMEMSCDEAVLRQLGDCVRADYAASLLALATGRRVFAGTPLAFGEGDPKGRIRNLAKWKKPALWVVPAAVLACGALAVCLLTDPVSEKPSGDILVWYDYLDTPADALWEQEQTLALPEFPGVTFHASAGQIWAENDVGNTILVAGMPIWNAFFYDLTGDGYPELLCTSAYGSGMIDSRVTILDYAKGVTYELCDRGNYDFYLRQAEGELIVSKNVYNTSEVVFSGPLVFRDGCIQVDGLQTESMEIFCARVVELDGSFCIAEPLDGRAARVRVSLMGLEVQVGDILEITYDGTLSDADPAEVGRVWNLRVLRERYYLTIGAESVASIEVKAPGISGGCQNADGSLYGAGSRVWLEPLDGLPNLWGVSIRALDKAGTVLWSASVPQGDENILTTLNDGNWCIERQ